MDYGRSLVVLRSSIDVDDSGYIGGLSADKGKSSDFCWFKFSKGVCYDTRSPDSALFRSDFESVSRFNGRSSDDYWSKDSGEGYTS